MAERALITSADRSGPYPYELLFADPAALNTYILLREQNAVIDQGSTTPWVLGDPWNFTLRNLKDDEKYIALRKRLVDQKSWDESGIYDHLMRGLRQRQRVASSRGAIGKFDGCSSKEEFVERYKRIDALIEQVKSDGRLKTAWEVSPSPFAQKNAVRVLLDRDGNFIFGGLGFHRLAIAKALNLALIPVALSIAHSDAVQNGHLSRHRELRDETLRKLGLDLPDEALSMVRK